MNHFPQQLASLSTPPVGQERREDKIASSEVQVFHNRTLPDASIIQVLIDHFFSCTGTLFYIFSPHDANELLRQVYMDDDSATKALLGALCGLAAVASQCDDNAVIDIALRQSYYETAKAYLDDCIEEDEVLGMRVLCCLAIYCAMDKRRAAWTWILTGLELARIRGLHLETPPPSTSPENWIVQRKVLRTLIFLACWFSSTLGRSPEILGEFKLGFESFTVHEDSPSVESIAQEQMTSIGVLTAGILQDVFLPNELSFIATRTYKLKLLGWFSELPAVMQLDSLLHNHSLTLVQRRSIFLVHLNYLGALLLLYRRHAIYLSTIHRDDSWKLDGDVDEALNYAKDAVQAATQSSRIFALLLSEQALFKRCWLVTYQSFSACTLLLFHLAQKRLHLAPPSDCEEDLSSALSCLKALEFCAEGDVVARGYYDMLMFYYRSLLASHEDSAMQDVSTATPDQVAEGVSHIINHAAFEQDWRDDLVPPTQVSNFIRREMPGAATGSRSMILRRAAVYENPPAIGGPSVVGQFNASSLAGLQASENRTDGGGPGCGIGRGIE
ncbi:hypothetical protein AYL99_11657 [Fonsecaea erecta]|uniref:Transcription factor domain-containing protein n=1 Tax=Fonsecaea erecta TaxID=1367422 RepID=A0A178Z2X0_9EURO|nr:hypothetical protein AYL99_11657 [Fonsecaea erecta]OAP54122.1 hypothetical protein AYL99_11657 [Fonsecaea erecta]